MCVKIIVAYAALVARSYPSFLAAITLEWKLNILKLELVLGVAEVRYLIVFHCFW